MKRQWLKSSPASSCIETGIIASFVYAIIVALLAFIVELLIGFPFRKALNRALITGAITFCFMPLLLVAGAVFVGWKDNPKG